MKSTINNEDYLLFLEYNPVQYTSTDNIQVLQYLITRSIHISKDVILRYKNIEMESNFGLGGGETKITRKNQTSETHLKQIFHKIKQRRNGVNNNFIKSCTQPSKVARYLVSNRHYMNILFKFISYESVEFQQTHNSTAI